MMVTALTYYLLIVQQSPVFLCSVTLRIWSEETFEIGKGTTTSRTSSPLHLASPKALKVLLFLTSLRLILSSIHSSSQCLIAVC